MDLRARPVPGAPALLLEPVGGPGRRWLIVADLHLGLGSLPARPSGPPGGAAEELADDLLGLARSTGARGVIVAGDVKHPIVGTPPVLRPIVFGFFSDLLAAGLAVEVVAGNHDGGLAPHLPREVVVRSAAGTVRGPLGIFHGHRWPSPAVLRAPTLVAGHLHPGFRFAPTPEHPDGKQRCWVRAPWHRPVRRARRSGRAAPTLSPQEIVVLPAFNPIAGTEALNRGRPARARSFLYRHFLLPGPPRAYLLDGTDLGPLVTP